MQVRKDETLSFYVLAFEGTKFYL